MAIANTTLILRKSGTPGVAPTSLANGELAINYADGKLYYKNAQNTITYISSGVSVNSFATINANSSLILATSNTDTLSIVPGNNISITTNTTSKTITINSTASGGGGSASGYQSNTILVANSTGYISNSNLYFTVSNNNLIVANSIIAGGGTGGNISGANNISANTITLGTGSGGSITGANLVSANTVNVTTALIFPDGSIQYTANTDSYARGAITSANANISLLQSYSNQANANIIAVQALANTDYTTLTASAGVYGNSTYVPVITLAANGRVISIVNTAIAATGGASLSGYTSNTVLVANSAGYIGNSNLYFTASNNNLIVANSIIAGGGTGGNISGANNISANTITLGTGYGGNISGANIISANTVNVATSLIFPDGSIQYTANTDSYARGAIASANANVALLQSYSNQANANINLLFAYVNTANANIASLNTYSQAAFAKANSSLQLSGTTQTVSSNVTIQGNLSVTGNVSYTGNVTSYVITGNTGQFFGYSANGFNALYAGVPTGYLLEPQILTQLTANYNGYAGGINIQNINSGQNASGDIFISADNGTINDGFLDLGIGSSTYNYLGQGNYNLINKNDAYLFVTGNTTTGGGNMIIGTGAPNDIVFAANGITTTNEVMRVSASGNNVTIKTNVASTSNTTGTLVVTGGVGVTGNVYSNRIYTNGLFWAANGNPISTGGGGGSGPVNTSAPTPPASGNTVNDTWYNTTTDVLYRYTYDGTSYYWVDINGPTVLANSTYSTISSSRAIAFSLIFGG